jgi:hypothetical protein
MERREDDAGANAEETAVELNREYGAWMTRQLGPDWVEVEPGIFMPAAQQPPEPESLDEALRAGIPEPRDEDVDEIATDPVATAPSRGRRGWFRRV